MRFSTILGGVAAFALLMGGGYSAEAQDAPAVATQGAASAVTPLMPDAPSAPVADTQGGGQHHRQRPVDGFGGNHANGSQNGFNWSRLVTGLARSGMQFAGVRSGGQGGGGTDPVFGGGQSMGAGRDGQGFSGVPPEAMGSGSQQAFGGGDGGGFGGGMGGGGMGGSGRMGGGGRMMGGGMGGYGMGPGASMNLSPNAVGLNDSFKTASGMNLNLSGGVTGLFSDAGGAMGGGAGGMGHGGGGIGGPGGGGPGGDHGGGRGPGASVSLKLKF